MLVIHVLRNTSMLDAVCFTNNAASITFTIKIEQHLSIFVSKGCVKHNLEVKISHRKNAVLSRNLPF